MKKSSEITDLIKEKYLKILEKETKNKPYV